MDGSSLSPDDRFLLKIAQDLPGEDVQRRFVGSDGLTAFREALAFWRVVKSHVQITPDTQGVDVGVGWGRLYRMASLDVPDLIGVDVDPDAVAMCQEAMPDGKFMLADGPMPLERNSRDLAYLYSVFSHLPEAGFLALLADLARVIRPGGHVAFTTMHARHLTVWQKAWADIDPGMFPALLAANFHEPAWRRRIDSGGFLYVPTGGGVDALPPEVYGEAIVTPAYLARALPGSGFHLTYFDGGLTHPQAHVIIRRDV